QKNILLMKDVRLDLKHSSLENATARLDLDSKQIQGQIPMAVLHIEDVLSEASGIAILSADLNGTLEKPSATFHGYSPDLRIGETQIDSAEVRGRLENDNVFL